MKKIVLVIAVMALMVNVGCLGGYVKDEIKNQPIANKMYIHSSPKKGDYAVLKMVTQAAAANPQAAAMMGSTELTMKIKSSRGGLFTIHQSTETSTFGAGFMNDIEFDLVIDRNGNVKRGTLIETDTNTRTKLKIAKNGDKNYRKLIAVTSTQLKKWNIPTRITVPAGTFSVTAKRIKGENDEVVVQLSSKRAKFGHVASYSVTDAFGSNPKSFRIVELVRQGRR